MGLSLLATLLVLSGGEPPAAPPDFGVTIERPKGAPAGFPRTISEPGDWIEHTIIAGENTERIAARYGVSAYHVKMANLKRLKAGAFRSGKTVRIKPRRIPPPRAKHLHKVLPGEDWTTIGMSYRVSYRDLRAWNWQSSALKPGREITVYVDPDVRKTLHPDRTLPRPRITISREGKSRGRPNLGRIENAVRLPPSWLYRLKSPPTTWGSSHAVKTILDAIVAFRVDHGFRGELIIGSISRRFGRRFPPHASHQSGRDVDIFLPLVSEVPFSWKPDPWMIDWNATWALIKAFDATGQVEMIFLDYKVQKYLYRAAKFAGATPEELKRLIGYPLMPHEDGHRDAIVRHGKDHTRHIHVRIACGPNEERCYSRWGDERYLAVQAMDKAAEKAAKGKKKRRRAKPAQ